MLRQSAYPGHRDSPLDSSLSRSKAEQWAGDTSAFRHRPQPKSPEKYATDSPILVGAVRDEDARFKNVDPETRLEEMLALGTRPRLYPPKPAQDGDHSRTKQWRPYNDDASVRRFGFYNDARVNSSDSGLFTAVENDEEQTSETILDHQEYKLYDKTHIQNQTQTASHAGHNHLHNLYYSETDKETFQDSKMRQIIPTSNIKSDTQKQYPQGYPYHQDQNISLSNHKVALTEAQNRGHDIWNKIDPSNKAISGQTERQHFVDPNAQPKQLDSPVHSGRVISDKQTLTQGTFNDSPEGTNKNQLQNAQYCRKNGLPVCQDQYTHQHNPYQLRHTLLRHVHNGSQPNEVPYRLPQWGLNQERKHLQEHEGSSHPFKNYPMLMETQHNEYYESLMTRQPSYRDGGQLDHSQRGNAKDHTPSDPNSQDYPYKLHHGGLNQSKYRIPSQQVAQRQRFSQQPGTSEPSHLLGHRDISNLEYNKTPQCGHPSVLENQGSDNEDSKTRRCESLTEKLTQNFEPNPTMKKNTSSSLFLQEHVPEKAASTDPSIRVRRRTKRISSKAKKTAER